MNNDLKISQAGLDLITKWEGLKLSRYICPAGKPTIGIGHVILQGELFNDPITREEAFALLSRDVIRFEDAVKKHIFVTLNQNQFDALVSFLFNVGSGGIINTKVQKAINNNEFSTVPSLLQEWSKMRVNGKLVTSPGLLNRRKSESDLFSKPLTLSVDLDKPKLSSIQTVLSPSYYIGKIDGIYGPKTEKAIMDFAQDRGITITILSSKKMDLNTYNLLMGIK